MHPARKAGTFTDPRITATGTNVYAFLLSHATETHQPNTHTHTHTCFATHTWPHSSRRTAQTNPPPPTHTRTLYTHRIATDAVRHEPKPAHDANARHMRRAAKHAAHTKTAHARSGICLLQTLSAERTHTKSGALPSSRFMICARTK